MTKIIGRQVGLGIGKETTRGTAVTPDFWIPFTELMAEDRVKRVNNETALAVLEDSDASEIIQKFGEIRWRTKLKDDHIGLVLYSLLGGVSSAVAGGESTVYEHTFSVGQTVEHQSLTLAHKDSNTDVAYVNAVIGSLVLTVEQGNYVNYEATALSMASESDTNTVSHTQEYDFVPQHLTFKRAADITGLDAAQATVIRNLVLEINSNITTEDVLGSDEPADILNQALTITGSITLTHDGSTFQGYMTNNTYSAFRIDITNPTTIGTAEKPSLVIDLNKCSIENYERSFALNEVVEESFDFKCHYELSNSEMLTAILTNEESSY